MPLHLRTVCAQAGGHGIRPTRGSGTTPRGWGLCASVDRVAEAVDPADLLTERLNFTPFTVNLNPAPFRDRTEAIPIRIDVYSPESGATIEFDNIETLGRVSVRPRSAC